MHAKEPPYEIAFGPVLRRGGCWGYFRLCADSSRFIATSWSTKRQATLARLKAAEVDRLRVKLMEPSDV